MKTGDIFSWLDTEFPLYLQEKYDNAGTQVVFPEENISGILFSLDLTTDIIHEAREQGCNVIITHHPYFFKALKKVDSSKAKSALLVELIDQRISCYAVHTNYDKFMNRFIEKKLGLDHEQILYQTDPGYEKDELGFGSISLCKKEMNLQELMDNIKNSLNVPFVIYSGDQKTKVNKIAILNGSGGNAIAEIIDKHSVDCILTGDVGHHGARDALDAGVTVVDAGHFGTEKLMMECLFKKTQEHLLNEKIALYIAKNENSPFRIY